MEQMMVQAAAPVQGVQGVSFRALQGALAGQQPVGDGFAMLFQQLMGALNGEGDPMAALLAQMGQMQDDAEDEGVELGMQMMAEMLLSGNPQAAQILEQLGLEPEQVQALAQAGLHQVVDLLDLSLDLEHGNGVLGRSVCYHALHCFRYGILDLSLESTQIKVVQSVEPDKFLIVRNFEADGRNP